VAGPRLESSAYTNILGGKARRICAKMAGLRMEWCLVTLDRPRIGFRLQAFMMTVMNRRVS
jgi:hypothetical protein